MNLQQLDDFHKTRPGYAVFGVIELAMAYGFLNWALDTGALWWWVIAFILLLGALQNFVHVLLPTRKTRQKGGK